MFCNAVNFLLEEAGSSILLCTATQPLLGRLTRPEYGQLAIKPECEIAPNPEKIFHNLRRNRFIDRTGFPLSLQEIAALAVAEMKKSGSCLVVTNTIKWAKNLFLAARKLGEANIFHLSTRLCPAHRLAVLAEIKKRLKNKEPVICFSTQVMECGVDLSFGTVIRLAAGLDSILQAAGRGNRNLENPALGLVYIVRADEEDLPAALADLKKGRAEMLRILHECPKGEELDLNRPELITRYFEYYLHDRHPEMTYPVPADKLGRNDNLVRLLSTNNRNNSAVSAGQLMCQSFSTAAGLYQVIPDLTKGILVPYGQDGRDIITRLGASFEPGKQKELLRKAQRYTVNVFDQTIKQLTQKGVLHNIQRAGILSITDEYYDEHHLGLLLNAGAPSAFLHI
jgi:CRISPR-associated endonuclease/helicase Cas3